MGGWGGREGWEDGEGRREGEMGGSERRDLMHVH